MFREISNRGSVALTISKRALENWYFEYCEAEREFLDAKRSFELKRRDICLFLFSAYANWCKNKFGEILRPERKVGIEVERPIDLFFEDFKVGSSFQEAVARLLDQAFDEAHT